MKVLKILCDKCGQKHPVNIEAASLTDKQQKGEEQININFICPNVALMYRVFDFDFDTRVNAIKSLRESGQTDRETEIVNELKNEWGVVDFDRKLERFLTLDLAFAGIPEEYYTLIQSVVSAYCCGYFYPAMTSAGALGERILNRLIIRLRDYFKSSIHYKSIYRKNSFEQWDNPVKILNDWGIISNEVAYLFLELKQFRNDSIHYNEGYDFEKNSHNSVKILAKIIEKQFDYTKRRDLFWTFVVPGEIWLRSNVKNDPFVKEFILPHCLLLGPFCEPIGSQEKKGKKFPLKPLSDESFLEMRKNRNNT